MKIPNWLRPKEIVTLKYWFHILILAVGVQFILNWFGHNMGELLSIHLLHITGAIAGMDLLAHSILKMD